MNRKLTLLIFGAALLGLGLSMPSCPGQQAMQQQIDQLTSKDAENTKRIHALESQVKTSGNDMAQVKTLLSQVSNAVLAQKRAIEEMDNSMKGLQASLAAMQKPAAKSKTAKKKK